MNNQARILLASLLVLASAAVSMYSYSRLPEKVPIHFDAAGNPNGWGPKNAATVFPVGVMLFFAGIYAASVHIIRGKEYWEKKLRQPISEEGYEKLVRNSLGVIDWVVLICMLMFLTIQVESFLTAIGKMRGLSGVWIFFVALFAGVFYGMITGLIARREALKPPPDPNRKLRIR